MRNAIMSTRNIVIALVGLLVIVLLLGFGFGWFTAEDQALPIIPEGDRVVPDTEREVVPAPDDVEQVEPTPPADGGGPTPQ
jgi:hypothetical protein